MNKQSFFTRKKVAGAVSILLALALLIGGTFAWNDNRQHKTNEAKGNGLRYKARLVENFNPNDTENWTVEKPPVTKTISVWNPGNQDNVNDQSQYGDIFVRLQLKEFMEFYPVVYERTEERYMIDTDGKFFAFDSQTAANAFLDKLKTDYGIEKDATRIVKLAMYNDIDPATETPVERYYIQTRQGDPNGIYGDFIVTGIDVDKVSNDTWNLFNQSNAESGQATNHNDHTWACESGSDGNSATTGNQYIHQTENGECLYHVHTWENGIAGGCGQDVSHSNLCFHDFVAWSLNTGAMMTFADWSDPAGNNCAPVAKWIVDTNSPLGWVYWGEALAPGARTEDLLKSITLISQPEDAFYYAIHTDMQAVSFSELGNWATYYDAATSTAKPDDNAQKIIDALKEAASKITNVYVTPAAQTVKKGGSQSFTATVVGANGPSQEVIWSISGAEKSSSINAQTGVLTIASDETAKTITVTATPAADATKCGTAVVKVSQLTPELEAVTGIPGETFMVDGIKWRVLTKDASGNLLIITEYLYGLGTLYNSTAADAGTRTKEYSAYNLSNLCSWTNSWYDANCTVLKNFAKLPSHLNAENNNVAPWLDWNSNAEIAAAINAPGAKAEEITSGVAFSLSVSEVNKYSSALGDKIAFDAASTTAATSWWLRSPGGYYPSSTSIVTMVGTRLSVYSYDSGFGVRPALWINLKA